jgi:hypothetical protein
MSRPVWQTKNGAPASGGLKVPRYAAGYDLTYLRVKMQPGIVGNSGQRETSSLLDIYTLYTSYNNYAAAYINTPQA